MKPTKYYSSFLLRFISYDRFMFRFADREEALNPPSDLLDRVRSCMIYLICSRPIITIIPESFEQYEDYCQFDINYRINDREYRKKVNTPKGLVKRFGGKVEVSKFPHTSIHYYDKDNNLIVNMLISNFVHLLEGIPAEVSNHEVLYIGKGTADCAIDRLNGHTTLEKILADVLRDEPNKEVVILLYNFEIKKSAISNSKIGESAEIRGETAKEHFIKIAEYKPGIDEQTKIAEALLIDYFSTSKYNTHFSNGLSLKAGIFDNIRDFDFDALAVELDNENIGFLNLFSKKIAPNYFHHALLDIRKLEGRISVFDPEE
ncbi:MAG: hypothetical protein WCR52_19700 [Bacteroidota bacterium]